MTGDTVANMDFRTESVSSLADQVRKGETSARDLVRHALSRIEADNPRLNAFVAVDGERALVAAASIDEQVASGGDPGPLAGIPIGVKDLEDAAGFVTTQGSALFADAQPARADSPLVARLVAAGCVVVGKTNTPELGWKADTDNALFGPTLNPWNLEHSPGGSSGGSAAAIAAGMVPLATGSDGGGSIRIPAACCGLSGIKASFGRVPMGGPSAPAWPNLSTRGPMARRMVDVVAALEVAVGPDPSDINSLPRAEASWTAAIHEPQLPSRVAWSPTLGYGEVDTEVLAICQRAVDKLASMGTEVVEVDTVFDEDPIDDWLVMTGTYNLRTFEALRDTAQWDRVDPFLKMLVDGAESLSALDIVHAEDHCHHLNLRLVELFHDVRLLITPTTAGAAPLRSLNGMAMVNGTPTLNWVQFTYPFNMTRSPAASICAGLTETGLPVGLQLIGPQHGDLVVLRSAAALEEAIGFNQLAPS
ncbi:MAG: amidase [Acidimicrobiaceae bacterium]|jgi:aspartyl-tRNA(Asn)/glutamyl-tRNA(Gln) amidotransferase subunit A|nr:amidase [Acidimicrobiaceae bacterium]